MKRQAIKNTVVGNLLFTVFYLIVTYEIQMSILLDGHTLGQVLGLVHITAQLQC